MHQRRLFVGCVIALVATAFSFIVRAQVLDDWGQEFNLSQTQKGEISGAGLYPFVITIVGFSLIVDTIGYSTTMVIAFICHIVSTLMLIFAKDANWLYWGTFTAALANGTVEAFINPVTATLYPKEKTHYLNILHAGWPGGLVLGGIMAIGLGYLPGEALHWKWKIALPLIPTVVYGVMLFGQKFPVNERVAAGVSYDAMLKEFFHPVFLFLVLVMVPLATTELGTDSWITDIMKPHLLTISASFDSGWVLVYTSVIMFVLRFFAGPIVHRISPLGLLAVSAAVACAGLYSLSVADTAMVIFLAATLYGFGKTFFWPTTLGVIAERFPKGGALTLNGVSGIGMLSAGLLGLPLIGAIQDRYIDENLKSTSEAVYAKSTEEKASSSLLGEYHKVDTEKVKTLPADEKKTVDQISGESKKHSLQRVAIFPAIMFVCYVALILYYRSQGGYKAEVLHGGT